MADPCSCSPPVEQQAADQPIRLYTEGDLLFDAMLSTIDAARHQVWLETYIFADDEVGRRFAHALSERARAGLDVRLMVDAVGSLFQFYRRLGPQLEEAGVQVRHFHPWQWRKPLRFNRRDHRKLLVVDDSIAFLGGFNIHRQSSQRYFGETRWRDTQASFSGELARQAARLFDTFWHGDRNWLPSGEVYSGSVLVPNQTRACRRQLACIYDDFFGNAEKSICVETPYFVPDHRIQKALIAAVARGVDVHILVPRISDVPLASWAADAVYARLLDAGVRIFEYLPRMLHAKVTIVDGNRATLGTANLDYRSLFQNYELNLISHDPDLCSRLQAQFESDLEEAAAVCATGWRQRPWVPRLAELVGWSVRRWL